MGGMTTEEQRVTREERAQDRAHEDAVQMYRVAVDLWRYEGEQVWQRNRVMLVASSILIAAVALLLTSDVADDFRVLSTALASGGLVLCVGWVLVLVYGFTRRDAYGRVARRLERDFLALPDYEGPVRAGESVRQGLAVWYEPVVTEELAPGVRVPIGLRSRVVAVLIPLIFVGIFTVAIVEVRR